MSITLSQIYDGLRYADDARWPGAMITYSLPTMGQAVWSPSARSAWKRWLRSC